MIMVLKYFIILLLISCRNSYRISCHSYRFRGRDIAVFRSYTSEEKNVPSSPLSVQSHIISNTKKAYSLIFGAISSVVLTAKTQPAYAIGDIYELKDQKFVLQDVAFNVQNGDAEKDIRAMSAVFQKTLKPLRSFTSTESDGSKTNNTVIAFGPDTYSEPPSYHPGVSSFFEFGGHATITLKSKLSSRRKSTSAASSSEKDGASRVIDEKVESTKWAARAGGGLQFIKIGTEVLRLSKGIANGASVSYAYGWVDMKSPSGIPFEIIVGVAKDPLMLACLAVADMQANIDFFTGTLGMKLFPFPYARSKGSQFEPVEPPVGKYFSYGENSMGILLVPISSLVPVSSGDDDEGTAADNVSDEDEPSFTVPSNTDTNANNKLQKNRNGEASKPINSDVTVSVGETVLLDGFTIVYDDSEQQQQQQRSSSRASSSSSSPSVFTAISPDGYKFRFLPYSTFKAKATSTVYYDDLT